MGSPRCSQAVRSVGTCSRTRPSRTRRPTCPTRTLATCQRRLPRRWMQGRRSQPDLQKAKEEARGQPRDAELGGGQVRGGQEHAAERKGAQARLHAERNHHGQRQDVRDCHVPTAPTRAERVSTGSGRSRGRGGAGVLSESLPRATSRRTSSRSRISRTMTATCT